MAADPALLFPSAVALCLDVLGIGTSSAQRQAAAARSLVELCRHRALRPAVDNPAVLRRLCRIIELTESATALAAAAEALFAIADDTAWQSKGGSVADVLRDSLARCVDLLLIVGDALRQQHPTATDPRVTSAAAIPDSASGPIQAPALASAAASMLRPSVLHLLGPEQLREAAIALAACLAGGCASPEVMAALAAVLRACGDGEDKVAAARAAVGFGAIAPLVRVLTSREESRQAVVGRPSNEPGGADAVLCRQPGKEPPVAGSATGAPGTQMSEIEKLAFTNLTEIITACCSESIESFIRGILGSGAAAALVSLLRLEQAPAGEATRALLMLIHAGGDTEGGGAVAAVQAALLKFGQQELHQQQQLVSAILSSLAAVAAEDRAQCDCAGSGSASDNARNRIVSVWRLAGAMLSDGHVTVGNLRQQAPKVLDTAVWAVSDPAARLRVWPASAGAAASALLLHVLEWAQAADEAAWRSWLPVSEIASGLLRRLLLPGSRSATAAGAHSAATLLARSLLLARPEDVWTNELERKGRKAAKKVTAMLESHQDVAFAIEHLATALLASGWSGTDIQEDRLALEAFLQLATSVLTRVTGATDAKEASNTAAQLAAVAGAVNAVLACLSKQHSVAGAEAQSLSPQLPLALWSRMANTTCALLGLYPKFEATTASGQPKDSKIQLQLAFKAPMQQQSFAQALVREATTSYSTVTAATTQPLLRTVGRAAERLTQLIASLLRQGSSAGAAGGSEAGNQGAAEAAELVQAALRVAGNCSAAVTALCLPPGVNEA